jgi:hypothetical protein
MGPTTRLRNSTRVVNARNNKPSPEFRRKPAARNPYTTGLGQGRTELPQSCAVLADIHLRLTVTLAAVAVCSAALRAQNADSDEDAAPVLKRCVGDELDRQIERIGGLLAGGGAS